MKISFIFIDDTEYARPLGNVRIIVRLYISTKLKYTDNAREVVTDGNRAS